MSKSIQLPLPVPDENNCVEIPLTQEKTAIIDAADYPLVSQYKWCAHKVGYTFYAATNITDEHGRRMLLHVHRLITNAPKGMDVDHINGNGLDNRTRNLRLATHAQNSRNSSKVKGTSRFKGIHFYTRTGKWQAQIQASGKRYGLGYFDDEVEAAKAYDAKARELFGEFARCNFPKRS